MQKCHTKWQYLSYGKTAALNNNWSFAFVGIKFDSKISSVGRKSVHNVHVWEKQQQNNLLQATSALNIEGHQFWCEIINFMQVSIFYSG